MTASLTVRDEHWPLASAFVIARGAKTEAHVLVVEISQDGAIGRGEAVPYGRYGQTMDGEVARVEALRGAIEGGLSRQALQDLAPAGAARNAVDCALWDLEAKLSGVPAWKHAGRPRLDPVKTCYTISLDTPEAMAQAARMAARRPFLKLKIGGADDLDRVIAVRAAAPKARLVVDANEGLEFEDLKRLAGDFARLDVKMIEQPLKAEEDGALEGYESPVVLCADESLHTRADLAVCARRYGAVNVKLDKAGGLTEALMVVAQARALGLQVMAGCMVATSLSMAPAMIIAQGADVVDLDGPLLLARDRKPGLVFDGALIHPTPVELWG
ncbi:N-acetyl-D-Glu racemase DgcA [Phenylobacterium sp. Root700]|uniref:N-acetyl-D-Glu racemase DgcA n=1 Tax=Phenylobacterium sp. Root700 TaxID=1736591 RepID=UPI00070003C9|nr:N-acetyl-D-Glu racemase DgcA [Phenylobacterium sp. Root700]KRB52522.1 mandelate racemase [Phenylobacterium sp. Root700]